MTQKIEGQMPATRSVAPVATRVGAPGGDRLEPVQGSAGGDSLRLTGEASSLQTIQRELSTASAVDQARVEGIRTALQSGTYRIDAQAIADRMMDLEDQLSA